jgi:hypothetical protein
MEQANVPWQLDGQTRIVLGGSAARPAERAAAYLQGEILRRSGLRWEVARGATAGPGDISLGVPGDGSPPGPLAPEHSEEIAVWTGGEPAAPQVSIRAGSPAAIMAAAGRFARALDLRPGLARTSRLALRERPAFPVRGHVFANHKQTTTYDKWGLADWEAYLAEMAAWGANIAVVYPLHPARWAGALPFGDGGAGEPWFASDAHRQEWERQWAVNLALPGLARSFGLRYGAWIPTNDVFWEETQRHPELTRYGGAYVCCAIPEARRRIRAIRERLFGALEHLDVLFLPSKDDGGCPGCERCTPWGPIYLELVQEQAAQARHYHPECKLWLATQGLTAAESDGLLAWLDRERPDWVEGLAYGPYSELMTFAPPEEAGGGLSLERYARSGAVSAGVSRIRAAVPSPYRIVLYPDETHTWRCQYPVAGMDPAVQLVWQREDAPSPRPVEYAAIHAATSVVADGAAPYSEGNTDDVNKVVWSARCWDPAQSGEAVAGEYARWHFGADVAADAARAILLTEQVLNRPLYGNAQVAEAAGLVRSVERARPDLLENWRWLNVRLGVLLLDYIQRVLHRDRQLGKELRYRAAVWHHEPDPLPGLKQTIAFLERRFAETNALLDECVWTRDRLFALHKLAVRGVARLQHSYMRWDVVLEEWRRLVARLAAGELPAYPERRRALLAPLQAAEDSSRAAGRGVPLVAPLQEFAWEQGETKWAW